MSRSIWELAVAVLGMNLWVTFLLLPALHLRLPPPGRAIQCLLLLPLGALALGLWLRRRVLLLGLFPLLCLVPPLASPRLVGVNVFTPLAFGFVVTSFLAYLLATTAVLGALQAPPEPPDQQDLGPAPLDDLWRRRFRMQRLLAVLAAVFPAVLLGTVFLHPGLRDDLVASFPQRTTAAQLALGGGVLLLWVSMFYVYFKLPLQAQVRGDPSLERELLAVRKGPTRPRAAHYLLLCAALGTAVLLVLWRI